MSLLGTKAYTVYMQVHTSGINSDQLTTGAALHGVVQLPVVIGTNLTSEYCCTDHVHEINIL